MTGLAEATELPALLAATRRAARGKRLGPNARAEIAEFWMDAEPRCLALQRALRLPAHAPGAWAPSPGRTFLVRDPKPRVITVAPFPDRVVHHALVAAVEEDFERYAIFDSYACRKGKGQHAALRRAQRFARGAPWALKMDMARYFASIDHQRLFGLVRRRVADPELCDLLERIVRAPAGRGLPIGALTSQHLANLYLGRLDHHAKDDLGLRCYLRYMDDVVLFGNREELRAFLLAIEPCRSGDPWRLVEERAGQRPCGQPQQEPGLEREGQPGPAARQLIPGSRFGAGGPVVAGLRTGRVRPGG